MAEKIKIGLSGASGRMGQSISELAKTEEKLHIQARHDSKNPLEKWDPYTLDVIIDFSSPEIFINILKWCSQHKKPLISGTTGLDSDKTFMIKETSRIVPLLYAPNMSLGIACLNEWLKHIPQEIKNWKIQIEEIHHQFKKDKPSGTALFLQETLENQDLKPPSPISKRTGNETGIHKIFFKSSEEELLLQHKALDRKVFARGALKGASWLIHQTPGLYKIKDCL